MSFLATLSSLLRTVSKCDADVYPMATAQPCNQQNLIKFYENPVNTGEVKWCRKAILFSFTVQNASLGVSKQILGNSDCND